MRAITFILTWFCLTLPTVAQDEMKFELPGALVPGSGSGFTKATVYFPEMRFPLEAGPAFANSQVYGNGGLYGPGGGQCDRVNYSYPWRDNYCESRQWNMLLCPSGKGHQGQDIRPATCRPNFHWAVAAEDGIIANKGSYSVTLQTPSGRLYRYLHLKMDELDVSPLEKVKAGDRIGLVSNFFPGSSTTIHLHFDVKDVVVINGVSRAVYLPPYSSLVESYKRLMENGR